MCGFIETPLASQVVQAPDVTAPRLSLQDQLERFLVNLAAFGERIAHAACNPRVYRLTRRYLRERRPVRTPLRRMVVKRVRMRRARSIHSHVAHGGSRAPPGESGSGSEDGPARPEWASYSKSIRMGSLEQASRRSPYARPLCRASARRTELDFEKAANTLRKVLRTAPRTVPSRFVPDSGRSGLVPIPGRMRFPSAGGRSGTRAGQ
jgi:hypothetical protein